MADPDHTGMTAPAVRQSRDRDSRVEINICSARSGKEGSSTDAMLGSHVQQVYAPYRRQSGLTSAAGAIRRAIQTHGYEKVLERTCAYAVCVGGQDPRYISFPAKFFRDERFNDAPETWTTRESKRPAVHVIHPTDYPGGAAKI